MSTMRRKRILQTHGRQSGIALSLKPKFWRDFDKEMGRISEELLEKRKDATLNIRVNSRALERLKLKATELGVGHHTFISELLRELASRFNPPQ